MDTLRAGLILLAATCIALICVTLARAGSTPTTQHEVVLIASAQDWSASPYAATIYSCTRSAGAPPCAIGANTAQVIADLETAGYRPDPALSALIEFGVVLVK